MPVAASTGPVLGRSWQHRPSTGPVQLCNGMFTGLIVLIGFAVALCAHVIAFSASICLFYCKPIAKGLRYYGYKGHTYHSRSTPEPYFTKADQDF